MKKLSAFLCVVLLAVTLSACQAFHDDTTQDYPQDEPFAAAVFLQVKDPTWFSIDLLTAWKADMERLITAMANSTDPDAPKITALSFRETIDADAALLEMYTVDLTISRVPPTTLSRAVRPFKIYYTQTVYNPIALLPDSNTFTYIIGYTSSRRHSTANTDWVNTTDDGEYVYFWTTGDTIEFHDVYPNRPLYYLLVFLGAGLIAVVVYLICRYNYCKKIQKPL